VTKSTKYLVILLSVPWLLVTANVSISSILVTLMMEALGYSETSALTRATRRNIPEVGILSSHLRENLKSYKMIIGLTNVFWNITPCGSSKNRRFEEHIASVFRVIGLSVFLAQRGYAPRRTAAARGSLPPSVVEEEEEDSETYHPEDRGDMFCEASFITRATRCNIPEDIRHCYRRENIPEDSVHRPYMVVGLFRGPFGTEEIRLRRPTPEL
jgi:hypothetical protein